MNIKYKISSEYSTTVYTDYVINTSIPVGQLIDVQQGEVLTVVVSAGLITQTTPAQTTTSQPATSSNNNDTDNKLTEQPPETDGQNGE